MIPSLSPGAVEKERKKSLNVASATEGLTLRISILFSVRYRWKSDFLGIVSHNVFHDTSKTSDDNLLFLKCSSAG